jgi:hypothetical protein
LGLIKESVGLLNIKIPVRNVQGFYYLCSMNKKEYDKKYYALNKTKILKHQKAYNLTHKKEHKKYNEQYCIDHKEEIAERKKQDYINNKEQHQKYSKEYNNTHKEFNKKRSRKYTIKRHGITEEQYKLTFEKQEGKCAICDRHQDELKTKLHIDHDHRTNKIRGLLCFKCNSLLGYANDNIILLQKAIEYLKNND